MVFPKEFINLQVDFALKAAEVTGKPLGMSLTEYTGIKRNCNFRHKPEPDEQDEWKLFIGNLPGNDQLKDFIYSFYIKRQEVNFPRGTKYNFGCFACEYEVAEKLTRIHFINREPGDPGPLSKIRRVARLEDLKSMFKFVKDNTRYFPMTTMVGGFSWLYNIDAYSGLFPEEYAQSGKEKKWFGSLALWGQMLDSSQELRPEAGKFLIDIRSKNNIEGLWKCFQYKPLETRCALTKFNEKYGIT